MQALELFDKSLLGHGDMIENARERSRYSSIH
jgi:hypothetical protein